MLTTESSPLLSLEGAGPSQGASAWEAGALGFSSVLVTWNTLRSLPGPPFPHLWKERVGLAGLQGRSPLGSCFWGACGHSWLWWFLESHLVLRWDLGFCRRVWGPSRWAGREEKGTGLGSVADGQLSTSVPRAKLCFGKAHRVCQAWRSRLLRRDRDKEGGDL